MTHTDTNRQKKLEQKACAERCFLGVFVVGVGVVYGFGCVEWGLVVLFWWCFWFVLGLFSVVCVRLFDGSSVFI